MAPSRESGFTLIELMIGMVVMTTAIFTALTLGLSLKSSFVGQKRAIGIERTARSTLRLLAQAARGASPGVFDGTIHDEYVNCLGRSGIEVFRPASETDRRSNPDAMYAVWGSGDFAFSREDFTTPTNGILVEGLVAADNGGFLRQNDIILIADTEKGHIFRITDFSVEGANTRILVSSNPVSGPCVPEPPSYNSGSFVIRVRVGTFEIDTGNDYPVLYWNDNGDPDPTKQSEPLALGAEDLQIAIGIDTNGDGVITEVGNAADDDEWYYNHPLDSDAPALTATRWKLLRITLTVRSTSEGKNNAVGTGLPKTEDRDAEAPDEFRRRTMSTIVEIRNLSSN